MWSEHMEIFGMFNGLQRVHCSLCCRIKQIIIMSCLTIIGMKATREFGMLQECKPRISVSLPGGQDQIPREGYFSSNLRGELRLVRWRE